MTKDEKKKIDTDSNVIFVGNKPPMNYVTAIMALLNSGNFNEVIIKARGNAISRAVDAAEITSQTSIPIRSKTIFNSLTIAILIQR